MKITTFGIVSNAKKKEIREVMLRVISLVPDGVRVVAMEDTACLLGIDQIHGEFSRVGYCILDCMFCDF